MRYNISGHRHQGDLSLFGLPNDFPQCGSIMESNECMQKITIMHVKYNCKKLYALYAIINQHAKNLLGQTLDNTPLFAALQMVKSEDIDV